MTKPTEYYKNKYVKEFRDNYLDVYTVGFDMKTTTEHYQDLKPNEIEQVNEYFKHCNKPIRCQYSLLSGSNFSGAEGNHEASSIRCLDIKYYGCNFANPIKKFISKSKKVIDEQIIEIHFLDEVIENDLIENFTNVFFEYNENEEYKFNIEDENNIKWIEVEDDEEQSSYIDDKQTFKMNETQEEYIYGLVHNVIASKENEIDINKVKQKLRSYYAANIRRYLNEKKIPLHSSIFKYNLKSVQNAHIIPFSECVKQWTIESLSDSINPYNCLRIDSNTHKLFDECEISFNQDGKIIDHDGNIKNQYLDIDNMPFHTKEFFNKYLQESLKRQIS